MKCRVHPLGVVARVIVGTVVFAVVAMLVRPAKAGAVPFLTFLESQHFTVIWGGWATAVSPDGASVYATSPTDDSLTVFRRTPPTGGLTFLEVHTDGMAGVDGLNLVRGVAVSPDGANVYTAGTFDNGTVMVFSRDSATGALTFLEVEREGVGGVQGLDYPYALAVSPDGRSVYVTASYAVVVFARDPTTGTLAFVEAQPGVGSGEGVAVSPEGTHVYATAVGNGPVEHSSVVVFERDMLTGALRFVERKEDNVGRLKWLQNASSVAVSPDGAHVYVTAYDDNALTVFRRSPTRGTLRFVEAHRDGVAGLRYLGQPEWVALGPDGRYVYVTARSSDALVIFKRNPATGSLSYVEAQRGQPGLGGAEQVAASPDGYQVFVVGTDGWIAVLNLTGCGNGVLDSGEACDEGVNNGPDQCCSLACEVIDTDGDGTCDRDDPCPHLPGAAAATLEDVGRVSLWYGEAPGGPDDRQRLSRASFTSGLAFNPITTHTVHVRLTNTGPSQGSIVTASLPPGGAWQQSDPARKRWRYVDRSTPLVTPVKRALLKERLAGSGAYEFTMSAKDGSPEYVPLSPSTDGLRVTLEIESGGAGVCVDQTLASCTGTPMAEVCVP